LGQQQGFSFLSADGKTIAVMPVREISTSCEIDTESCGGSDMAGTIEQAARQDGSEVFGKGLGHGFGF
jgi:hypothetical protein